MMAEVKHFVDLGGRKHAKFDDVKHIKLSLLNRDTQLAGKADLETMTIGQAVNTGIVDNETLGYFLVRVLLFLR